ncbi:MAG: 30S ribosomal protein S4 [Parcubacteria group bacterium GW2011_GWA2_38_13b]|nr:MAG: 30S ribosomal protein S4 [Parcubacteria group bacterium GW2011_GWA2_38_13b]
MMNNSKCVKCRRAGIKLFLKGDRCFTPKCAMIRKPSAPGVHGRKRPGRLSEYGLQLKEKQKLKRIYGLREKQFGIYVKGALKKRGVSAALLMRRLEMRLDNVIFRLGLASSRKQARQMVLHGFFKVNGIKTDRPSFLVKKGDNIVFNESKMKKPVIEEIKKKVKKHNLPEWLELDGESLKSVVKKEPTESEIGSGVDLSKIIEFYSR